MSVPDWLLFQSQNNTGICPENVSAYFDAGHILYIILKKKRRRDLFSIKTVSTIIQNVLQCLTVRKVYVQAG